MKHDMAYLSAVAVGTTLGGLLVGGAEAIYRDAEILYAALLYGALWALVGLGAWLLLALLPQHRLPKHGWLTWGLVGALGSSTVVLLRFVLLRDLFHEAPGHALTALAVALLVGAGIVAVGLLAGHYLRRRWQQASFAMGNKALALPLAVLAAFAVRTDMGEDQLPQDPPAPKAKLHGEGIVLIVADALRADALGLYGAPPHRGQPPSPSVDRWAREALVFQDTSAQASWTKPAVASLLTSRHVPAHNTMAKTAVLPDGLPTVASVLQAAGVHTAAVVTNYNLEPRYGFDRGFTEYRYLPPARYLGAPPRANRLAAYNTYRLLREKLLARQRQARHFYRSGRQVNAAGLEILDRIGNERFFLYLHYMEPHDPFFAEDGTSFARVSDPHPPRAWAQAMRQAYQDDVLRFDRAVSELRAGLRARGLLERATLILTADHGEEFGEHGGYYHGVTLYEEQLALPLLISGPGLVPGQDTRMARQIDIGPTIVARYGVKPPASWEGRDLLADATEPEATLAHEDHQGHLLRSIRQGHMKLILANQENPRGLKPLELYDLARDPGEQHAIAEQTPKSTTLLSALDEADRRCRSTGAEGGEKALDESAEAELRALGYIE